MVEWNIRDAKRTDESKGPKAKKAKCGYGCHFARFECKNNCVCYGKTAVIGQSP